MPLHTINDTIDFIQEQKTTLERILYIMENDSKNDYFEGINNIKKKNWTF